MNRTITVVGGGLGGLATAALLGRAGHKVTLVEGNEWLGGKSRRIEVAGQRIDTGPSLVTFPGVWQQILEIEVLYQRESCFITKYKKLRKMLNEETKKKNGIRTSDLVNKS